MAGTTEQAGSSLKRRNPGLQARVSGVKTLDGNHEMDNSTAVSNSNVIPFDFRGYSVRAVTINGEPWFVAADVCRVLEVANTSQAMHALDDDERSMFNIGRQGEANIVNESGLYTLILRSRDAVKKGSKPHAFRKWVTAEVLPAIRKHGRYEDVTGKMNTLVGQTIGTDGFHMLGAVVKGKVSSLPAAIQRRATAKIWSQAHAAFGVRSAADIPADQLDAARNFVAAYALEGEYIPGDKTGNLSMSIRDWLDRCPVLRAKQAFQPANKMLLTSKLIADMDSVKPLDILMNALRKQGVDVSAYDAHYQFLLDYLRENRRSLSEAMKRIEHASENSFLFHLGDAA